MAEATTILLADDHSMVLSSLKCRLEQEQGITVVSTVSNAGDALTQALRLRPDILLLDIEMPGQECFSTARAIKTQVPESRIVFLSAFQLDHYIEQAVAMGAAGYILKTESSEKLIAAIHAVRAGGVYYSPEIQARIILDERRGHRLEAAGLAMSRAATLTDRETEVLRFVAQGLSKKEIAGLMHVTVAAVDRHCTRMMTKLDIHDRVGLARFAFREGLAQP